MSEVKDAPLDPQTAKQEFKHEAVELVKMVAWFLILFGILRTFVVEGYEVQGDSMLPTVHDRERILVFKLPHNLSKLSWFSGLEPLKQGNIVVFDSTVEPDKRYIKRVIAHGLNEPRRNTVAAEGRENTPDDLVNVQFQNGTVYVNYKRVSEDYLPVKPGACDETDEVNLAPRQYYVLGDNRRVSKDSRSFGPVDDRQIIGRAIFRFWPLSKFGPL